jgi:predicted permease
MAAQVLQNYRDRFEMNSILRDFHYAFRQWKHSPGFAIAAVTTLALGIGANTGVFLLTYSILLKSLPVPHPEQLIRYAFRRGDSDIGLSYLQYQALAKQQGVATGIFGWHNGKVTVRRNDQAEKVPMAMATGSIFDVLQLHPALGREFEKKAGEPGVPFEGKALLGYEYWRTTFQSDPNILGRTLNLEGNNITIIGVLPPGFEGVEQGRAIDILLPLSFEPILNTKNSMLKMQGGFFLTVMGRLRPGQSLRSAQANLGAINEQVAETADPSHTLLHNGFFSDYKLQVEAGSGGRSWLRSTYMRPLIALEGLCGFMLLLCALNVGLLVLSRVSGRLHEFSVRSALGASRERLLLQVMTETLVLGLGGMVGGSWLGWALAKSLIGMISEPGSPVVLQLQAGVTLFLFASGISLFTASLAGAWPAWRASRNAPALDLKQLSASRRTGRLGLWLIPAQVMLGTVLLYAAVLLSGTLLSYLHESSGFSADNVVMAELDPPAPGVSNEMQRTRALEFLQQVEAMPGIQSAAVMNIPPVAHSISVSDYYVRDQQGSLRLNRHIWAAAVSVHYFNTMGTAIRAGRAFTRADLSGDKVCLLSASAATYFYPNESAVGQMINAGDGQEKVSDRESCRIIGVAQDARLASMLQPPPLTVYHSIEQQETGAFIYPTLAVRGANPGLASDAIHSVASRVLPGTTSPRTWLFRDAIDFDLGRQRLLGSVSGGFALLALALLGTGLYGVLMRWVAEQRREIGIRMALGAQRDHIVGALAQIAGVRVAIGAAAGVVLAAASAHVLRPLLYGVSLGSPRIIVPTMAVLLLVLAIGMVVPVTRAACTNPAEIIRDE